MFLSTAKITLSSGADIEDTNKHVEFADGIVTGGSQSLITVGSGCTATFGTLIDADDKTTRDGCTFISYESTYTNTIIINSESATTNLYSCSFAAEGQAHYGIKTGSFGASHNLCKIYNTAFIGGMSVWAEKYAVDIYNSYVSAGLTGALVNAGSGSTIDGFKSFNSAWGIQQSYYSASATLENVIVRNSGTNALRILGCSNAALSLVNPDIDSWGITWGGTCTNFYVYRQYEFDLALSNSTMMLEDMNVTLTKNGSVEYSGLTDASGAIPTQTLTYGYYDQAHGSTIQDATPYTLEIFDPAGTNGNYTSTFYPTAKIDWAITLQEAGITEEEQEENVFVGMFLMAIIAASVSGLMVYAGLKRRRKQAGW